MENQSLTSCSEKKIATREGKTIEGSREWWFPLCVLSRSQDSLHKQRGRHAYGGTICRNIQQRKQKSLKERHEMIRQMKPRSREFTISITSLKSPQFYLTWKPHHKRFWEKYLIVQFAKRHLSQCLWEYCVNIDEALKCINRACMSNELNEMRVSDRNHLLSMTLYLQHSGT